jgi:hypothetical protein
MMQPRQGWLKATPADEWRRTKLAASAETSESCAVRPQADTDSEGASFEVKPKDIGEGDAEDGLIIRVAWAAEPNKGVTDNEGAVITRSSSRSYGAGATTRNARGAWRDGSRAKEAGLGQGRRGSRVSDRHGSERASGCDGAGRGDSTNLGGQSGHFWFPLQAVS